MGETWFDAVPNTRFADVSWVAEIGSTNTELMDLARSGLPEGRVMIADLQTAGRGRRGRTWTAPAGTSLMMSALLRPPPGVISPSQAALVVSAWACAAAEACEQEAGVRPGLKWPNDLVVRPGEQDATKQDRPRDLKVAGILAETLLEAGEVAALVIGMGLNTGWPEVPTELADTATSLNLVSGSEIDRVGLAYRLLTEFEQRYGSLVESPDGLDAVLAEARRRSVTLGSRVQIELDAPAPGSTNAESVSAASPLLGQAVDIDLTGALVVLDDNGQQHILHSADVVHLRPA